MSSTLLSKCFMWMIDHIHAYSTCLNDLTVWEADFPAFAVVIETRTDRHFQRIVQPGGHHNMHCKLSQCLLYSSYYKTHGLKYIDLPAKRTAAARPCCREG